MEIVLAIAITVAAIWVLFSIGARVYAGAVLQTGRPDEAPRRVAVRGRLAAIQRLEQSRQSAGVPEDDRSPSHAPERDPSMRPASAFAV